MKEIFLFSTLLLWNIAEFDLGKIAKMNRLKQEAESAYKEKKYNVAANRYAQLVELGAREDAVLLNLANAYFEAKEKDKAKQTYSKLTASTDRYTRSRAFQQLSIIKAEDKKLEEALEDAKRALKAMPENEEARHNYELIKKLLEQQKKNQKQEGNDNKQKEQNQDQQSQDQKDQQKQDEQKDKGDKSNQKDQGDSKEQEGKDGKPEEKQDGDKDDKGDDKGKEKEREASEKRSQRLQQMNMSEEQAKMILDAMKNSEAQYLQQQKRKPTQKTNKNRPDW